MITINTAVSSYNARIEDEFPNLFGGIGKIKNTQVQLHIDTNVTPKQQKHRHIPFHIRKDVEKELMQLALLSRWLNKVNIFSFMSIYSVTVRIYLKIIEYSC
jgi:hypothetical protein